MTADAWALLRTLTPWQSALDHGDAFYIGNDPRPHWVTHCTTYYVHCVCGGRYLRSSCRERPTP